MAGFTNTFRLRQVVNQFRTVAAASNAANFSATHRIEIEDKNGDTYYVPAMNATY